MTGAASRGRSHRSLAKRCAHRQVFAGVHPGGSQLISALTGTWGPRVAWLLVGIAGAWSIGDAIDGTIHRGANHGDDRRMAGLGHRSRCTRRAIDARAHRHAHGRRRSRAARPWPVGSCGAAPAAGVVFVACDADLRAAGRWRRVRTALRAGVCVRRRASLPAASARGLPSADRRRRSACGSSQSWPHRC